MLVNACTTQAWTFPQISKQPCFATPKPLSILLRWVERPRAPVFFHIVSVSSPSVSRPRFTLSTYPKFYSRRLNLLDSGALTVQVSNEPGTEKHVRSARKVCFLAADLTWFLASHPSLHSLRRRRVRYSLVRGRRRNIWKRSFDN